MAKNAHGQLQDACSSLQCAQSSLQQGISTVEKPENKKDLQCALDAVQNAMSVANNALTNYKD